MSSHNSFKDMAKFSYFSNYIPISNYHAMPVYLFSYLLFLIAVILFSPASFVGTYACTNVSLNVYIFRVESVAFMFLSFISVQSIKALWHHYCCAFHVLIAISPECNEPSKIKFDGRLDKKEKNIVLSISVVYTCLK